MVRPFRSYRALAAAPDPCSGVWQLLRRPLLMLLVFGAFVSLSTAGRLVAFHVAATVLFWSFVPALQVLALFVLHRLLGRRTPTPMGRVVDLFFMSQGPWLLFFTALIGVCLFAPRVYAAFTTLLEVGVLPGMLALAMVWGMFLSFACFRAGLAYSRLRALLATLLFYLCYWGALLGYFLLTNQAQPILIGQG